MLSQTHAAQKGFWIPPVSQWTLLACYLNPFGHEFFLNFWSYPMAAVVYALTIISICASFKWRDKDRKIAMWLSLVIFNFTVLTAAGLSFVLRPLLYHRYIMCVITMLMVPPAVLLASGGYKWLKMAAQGLIICCGAYIYIATSYFSFGPYKQSLDYLQQERPGVNKIVHVAELTAGPFYEYGRDRQWRQYCLKNENSVWFTNMDVFEGSRSIADLNEVLAKDEVFCVPRFPNVPLNEKNYDLILSQSETVAVDTVQDNRPNSPAKFLLYILKYRGKAD